MIGNAVLPDWFKVSLKIKSSTLLCSNIIFRDHVLSDWIQVITSSSSTELMYDPVSFLRDPELISFLLDTINWTKDTSLTLEPLFAQGL